MQAWIASLVRAVDAATTGTFNRASDALRVAWAGPLQGVLLRIVLWVVGAKILLEQVFGALNRGVAWIERAIVLVAMLGMTALTFNDYLVREAKPLFGGTDLGGLWAIEGQINFALLLVVIVGFVGASLATHERKHLAVDALDQVLSPGAAVWVKRFTALVAAGLCWILMVSAQETLTKKSRDTFEGARVWAPLVIPVNLAVDLLDPAIPIDTDGDGLPNHREIWKLGTDPLLADTDGDGLADGVELLGPDGEPDTFDEGDPLNAPGTAEADKRVFERPKGRVHLEFESSWKQTWLRLPIGDRYGPGTTHASMGEWEDAIGLDFDELPPVFARVKTGDKFPLWIPLQVIVYAFGLMALRFFGHALYPPSSLKMGQTPPTGPRKRSDVVLAGAFPGALIALGLGVWLGSGAMILIGSVMLVLMGAPLFVAIGVGTVSSWVLIQEVSAGAVIDDIFEATKKHELLAIPLFVLAGNLMTKGSIARRLIGFTQTVLGGAPGGLGAGAVLACALFAAISGSSPVTVIAIGSIMFPMLIKDGYSERYSMGVLTTAGGLGIIIPPSIPMIVYAIVVSRNPQALQLMGADGTTTQVSIDPAALFKAGILPGLFIATMLVLYTFFVSWPRTPADFDALQTRRDALEGTWLGRSTSSFFTSLPSLMLPVLILGGIYGWFDLAPLGIPFAIRFTVTEAAAFAVVYALFIELVITRELKLRDLSGVVSDSAVMMGSLFLILCIAISLNKFLVWQKVPELATAWMLDHVDSTVGFLIMVNLFLLAVGCVMDILSAILIVAPLLAPIAASYGIHPVHFGIMFIVNLELGYLTPPMGINLFVASTVFDRPIVKVIRAVLPFLFVMLFCLAVIVLFPWLSLAFQS